METASFMAKAPFHVHSSITLVSLALAAVALAAAPGPQRGNDGTDIFRSGVDVVQVTATVTDADGRLVADLERDDFEIFEDGRLQTLTHFTRDRVPLSLGVVLDISQSMSGQRIDDSRLALDQFLADRLDPADEVFVIVFNHSPVVEVSWTLGPRRVRHRLDTIPPWGGTSIYDAMMEALPLFESRANQRAAVVLISDGADTGSRADVRDVRRQLRRSDAFVYAIAIDAPETRAINDRVNPSALREMTAESGGYTEVVHDSLELAPATARIADELNHQYTLSYTPTRSSDGTYRSIRVRVAGDYRVRNRRGYVADPHLGGDAGR